MIGCRCPSGSWSPGSVTSTTSSVSARSSSARSSSSRRDASAASSAVAQRVQRHARLAVAHGAQRLRELALAAEVADARIFELGRRRRARDRALCLALQRLRVHRATVPSAFVSACDAFAVDYEEWAAEMTEDIPFYVELAREADGPLVELAVGNGRVAIPVAQATGKAVLGIDISPAMLAQARANAEEAGVELELREGDMRELDAGRAGGARLLPVPRADAPADVGRPPRAFERVAAALEPGGRFAWNAFVFNPHIAGSYDGHWQDDAPVRHRVDYFPADARIDITLEDGRHDPALVGRRAPSGKG